MREELRCHGRCSDPGCTARCRDEHGDPLSFSDYFLCVFGTVKEGGPADGCATPCGGGDNWECLGGYSWEAAPAEQLVVSVSLIAAYATAPWNPPLNGVAGAQLAWCPEPNPVSPRSPDAECADWKETDGYGRAELRPTQGVGVLALTSQFLGMRSQLYVPPVRRSGALVSTM